MLSRMSIYLDPLQRKFEKASNLKNAVRMSAYMKDRYKFFGIKSPDRRKIQKEFIGEHGLPEFNNLADVADECFDRPQREFHHFGIELCGKMKKHWTPGTMDLFENMATTRSWWDTVDAINIFCIKPYFAKFPEADIYSITQSWIDSGNIWLQRLSIIFQLRLTDKTDTRILRRNILQLKHSEEFFVQKAIGWALRDFWRTDPGWVVSFVAENDLKPLSRREALKHT